jgi:hypothetical protein
MEHDRVAMSPCLEFLSEIQPNTKPWEDNDDGSGYKEIRYLEDTVKKLVHYQIEPYVWMDIETRY